MKKTLAAILALVMVLSMLPAGLIMSSALTSGDYTYTVVNGQATVTKYTGASGNVVIPETLGGYPVTGIIGYKTGSAPFYIYRGIFYGCIAPTTVTVPATVTSIGDYAFKDCSKVTAVNIPGSVTTIGIQAFSSCKGLTNITIADSVTALGSKAFELCSALTVATIGNGVVSLTDSQFYKCTNLMSVAIGRGLTSFNTTSLDYCVKLAQITVDSQNNYFTAEDDVLFNKQKTTLFFCPAQKTGDYVIPDGVSIIDAFAFQSCTEVTGVNMPDSITTIGKYAFFGCSGLTTFNIGKNVSSIGIRALSYCNNLTQITVDGGNNYFAALNGVLFNRAKKTLIQYPGGIAGDYVIPDGVTTIARYAFQDCRKLSGVVIPSGVTFIGEQAFADCSGLTSIILPSGLNTMELYAFVDCTKLISAYFLGNAPTSVGSSIFGSCADGFTVYYLSDKTGFTSPTWKGYPTAVFSLTGEQTITFNANGGTGGTSVLMVPGSALTAPVVTRTGYAFAGWSPSVPPTVPDTDTTYTAQWTINNYTINFDANGGSAVATITQNYNTIVEKPEDPVKTGYTFEGWHSDAGLTSTVSWPYTLTNDVTFYAKWTYADADYSAVDAAILLAEATTLPASAANDPMYRPGGDMYIIGDFTNGGFYARSMFTSASLSALTNAVNAVVRGKNSSEQATVDGYAAAITAAYNNLVLASADYTALNALIAQAEGLDRDIYTEDSLNMLDAVVAEAYDAVAEAYKLPLQDIVDDKASALENALNSMEYVDADYSEVNLVWSTKPANLTQNYTPDSVANLMNYYNQEIIWDLKADQQAVVDGYADDLIALIAALVLKPADYTGVDNAIKAIPDNDGGLINVDYTYLYTIYNNSTVSNLANAVNAVVYGKPITEQAVVDGYAAAINSARIALIPLNADYTYLGIALNTPPAWPQSYYTEASYLAYTNELDDGWELYNNQNLNITQQYIINDQIYLIEQAYAALTLKDVTYTVKYQTVGGTTLAADVVKNATAAQWITETAVAVTGHTPVQATIQQRMTGTSSENIIIFTYTLPVPTKAGYVFAGWYQSPPSTFSYDYVLSNFIVANESDHTLYAKWSAPTYNLNFDPNGEAAVCILL
jgi:uncharacterized repeat protein (TIGR02543 family)